MQETGASGFSSMEYAEWKEGKNSVSPVVSNVSETVSGGGSITTTHGTEHIDTDTSIEWQSHADNIAVEKLQYRADFIGDGGTKQALLRDPVYQDMGRQQLKAESNAYKSQEVETKWTETSYDINKNMVGQPTTTKVLTATPVNIQPDVTPSTDAPAVHQREFSSTPSNTPPLQEAVTTPVYNVVRDRNTGAWVETKNDGSTVYHSVNPNDQANRTTVDGRTIVGSRVERNTGKEVVQYEDGSTAYATDVALSPVSSSSYAVDSVPEFEHVTFTEAGESIDLTQPGLEDRSTNTVYSTKTENVYRDEDGNSTFVDDMGEEVTYDELAQDDPRWAGVTKRTETTITSHDELVSEADDPNLYFDEGDGEYKPVDEMALDDPRREPKLSPEDDPNMVYDDATGEYEPIGDQPDNWDNGEPEPLLPENDPNMVYDDDLGEYVPKDDIPANWDNGEPIPPEVDADGCEVGYYWSEEDLSCVPNTLDMTEFGCTKDERYDDEAGYCVRKDKSGEDYQEPPPAPIPKDVYSARRAKASNKSTNDWRVRLSLAPQAEYLYNKAGDAGILEPLRATDGVIFPYVPKIDTIYHATYNQYDLTHSNYRGYFYQNSYPGEMLINATFTAQDTKEANYILAVIHFLRSCTKMFYGQDAGNPNRGSPPPLVFLRGLGEHQFNEHPCVVSLMNYNLPDDVDYIKASVGGRLGADTDPFTMNNESKPTGHQSWSSKISRLWQADLEPGATPTAMDSGGGTMTIKGRRRGNQGVSRVPTKLEVSFNLLPIQTRDQVSNQYSMDKYGTGELLKRGFY
jgi:hypothetical protein